MGPLGGVGLDHAELHPAFFGDHVLVPGGVPDELDVGFINVVDGEDFCLGVCGDDGAHAAAWGGEGHFYLDDFFTVDLLDGAVVDEAEVDDVDGDFGVVDAF